jgi:formylglycine-generating enzyme required for sulfatase activity
MSVSWCRFANNRISPSWTWSLALCVTACTGERFTSTLETLDSGLGGVDGSTNNTAQATECGTARVGNSLNATEVCIPSSQFSMGATAANLGGGFSDHTPPHNVTLSAYFIDAYEVTVSRFRACVLAGTCQAPSTTGAGCTYVAQAGPLDALPVNCVLYSTAVAFCKWDGGRRLPTEAEWERAARGTQGFNYPWGNDFTCERAVAAASLTCPDYDPVKPASVGTLQSGTSAEGAFDLVGNVAEWVADWAGTYPRTDVTDPAGPATGTQRVVRGGDWLYPTNQTPAYLRRSSMPANAGTLGFRCARDAT